MKPMIPRLSLLIAMAIASPALGESPAARVGDQMNNGGAITGPGAPTVLIGGQPAARVGDFATDPLVAGVVPCVGGQILIGSTTVLIGGRGAARVGDTATTLCALGVIVTGSSTVLIGN